MAAGALGVGMRTTQESLAILRQRGRSSGEVAYVLEQEIRDGIYPVDSRLPTEAALATRFGISRSGIREAIAELRRAHLVITHQGSGSFVAASLPEEPVFSLSYGALDSAELRHVYEIRREVEAGAAALAAANATHEDHRIIQEAVTELARAIDEGRPGSHHDLTLHQAIAVATGNRFFTEFLTFFHGRVSVAISTARSNSSQVSGQADAVQNEHQMILDSIVNGEPEEARAAMRVHLTNAMRRLGLDRLTQEETK